MNAALLVRAEALVAACRARGLTVATAESCTGGGIAALLTEVAGSSAVLDRGFVTYSNAAKAEMLGIDPALIERVGAVSAEVAVAMAEGALGRAGVDLAVAVTGIAGPGGATDTKPVGLVHLALAGRGRATRHVERRYGDLGRSVVRERTTADAIVLLEQAAG